MSNFFYDIHIHSILSPCADVLMTPNNILNMAMLKELDFISITDHNSTKQLEIFSELLESYDLVLLPGVEVTVLEDFDVLCYFESINLANQFNSVLEKHLLNNWGNYSKNDQVITDIYDQEVDTYNLPLTKTNLPYNDLVKEVRNLDGVIVLAHINRKNSSVLNSYKLCDIDFDALELQKYGSEKFLSENEYLLQYKILYNSDSHTLMSISEREYSIDLKEKTVKSFLDYLRGKL
ncbi:hypothetical protein CI105_01005 [Candidatus Izimaplasma bacterium ZiA1]|nr:hypothetical protein CI105_01005 [Candidatus Izimaplasma bacterium ZiA1]